MLCTMIETLCRILFSVFGLKLGLRFGVRRECLKEINNPSFLETIMQLHHPLFEVVVQKDPNIMTWGCVGVL